jgi:ABC-type nitrate/sulfonate/bicarbonate transport system permease component
MSTFASLFLLLTGFAIGMLIGVVASSIIVKPTEEAHE